MSVGYVLSDCVIIVCPKGIAYVEENKPSDEQLAQSVNWDHFNEIFGQKSQENNVR